MYTEVGCVLGTYKETSDLSRKNKKNENTKKYKNIIWALSKGWC